MDSLEAALAEHFGFEAFRPGQRPVVEAILDGRPTVAVMPTGAGKSLCYQLPALCLDGVTVVVSPLIALMKDQVDALRAHGIPAAYVNSTQPPTEQRAVLEDAAQGHLRLLYVAPERFRFEGAVAMMQRIPVALFVVDEAHCISAWGHDFRPDYLTLGHAARTLRAPRIAAFTATATAQVRDDIVARLGLAEPFVSVSGFLRENLHLSVLPIKRMKDKERHLLRVLEGIDGPVVVYCATRRHCEEVAEKALRHGHDAAVYHGGLEDDARRAVQEDFISDRTRVIVATNAFGMGIDKPDVRAVIHWEFPGSVEAYYQQAGRAGRDGKPALCALLFTYADKRIQEFFIDKGGEDLAPERRAAWAEAERRKLGAMIRYAYEEGCRHAAILRYFGERLTIGEDGCGACDRCTGDSGLPGVEVRDPVGSKAKDAGAQTPRDLDDDEVVVVQKVLSAVARSRGRLGVRQLAWILRGSERPEIADDPLAHSRSFGILADHPQRMITGLVKELGRAGCTAGRRPVLTDLGADVMWRRARVRLAVPPLQPKRKSGGGDPGPSLDEAGRRLFERLEEARLQAARSRGVPAYVIATNKVLAALAASPPPAEPEDAWLAIKGVGPTNVTAIRDTFEPVLAEARSAGDDKRAAGC
ncbi:MAG: RecQ family ATP-dependent DNA helicase [Myxococcota bacterium]